MRRVLPLLVVSACTFITTRTLAGEASLATNDPILEAENAVAHLAQGKYGLAVREAYSARRARPNDADIEVTLGAVLLATGDARGATAAMQLATEANANDAVAQYGAGIAHLASGHRASALDSFGRSERLGGDRSILLVARRYTQCLDGAQLSLEGAGVSDEMAASAAALQGMSEARQTDWKHAVEHLAVEGVLGKWDNAVIKE